MATPSQSDYLASVRTASEVISEANQGAYRNEQEARDAQLAAVESAGVINESYLDYGAALANYAARDDIEPLESRRARDVGTVAEQDFMRQQDQRPENP